MKKPRKYTPRGEPQRFAENAILSETDACIFWPHSRGSGGYGNIHVGNTLQVVSRYVCKRVHGEPPSPAHEAGHSCNNGHLACINPRHLSWQTKAQNMEHKIASGNTLRGLNNPRNVLSEQQVREIKALKGELGARKIGLRYGVCETTVLKIHRGTNWGWLTG